MAYYHLFWDDKKQEPHSVKSGFNFLACFFGLFYFLYHRAWISAGAFFAANLALVFLQSVIMLPQSLWVFVSLVFNLYIGFDGSDCLFGEYHKKGYRYLKSEFYASKEQAIADIFKLK